MLFSFLMPLPPPSPLRRLFIITVTAFRRHTRVCKRVTLPAAGELVVSHDITPDATLFAVAVDYAAAMPQQRAMPHAAEATPQTENTRCLPPFFAMMIRHAELPCRLPLRAFHTPCRLFTTPYRRHYIDDMISIRRQPRAMPRRRGDSAAAAVGMRALFFMRDITAAYYCRLR